jgi:hypothetical protein
MTMADEEKAQQPQQVTNAVLKEGITAQGKQLEALWNINREQTVKLAKLEDVPEKLDRLLAVNTNMAAMQQQQITHNAQIKANSDDIAAINLRLSEHMRTTSSRFSYYAGAGAVIVLLGGFFLWLGQEAVEGTFAQLSNIHAAVQSLQQDVSLLQFQEGGKTQSNKGASK